MEKINTSTAHKFSYGLFVLTAKDQKDVGCINNTAIQVTSQPYKISITVNKSNFTTSVIENTGVFNVSILSENAKFDVFKRFGFASSRDVDKFDGFPCPTAENGVKYVDAPIANAYLSAKVTEKIDLGTHYTFFADVVSAEVLDQTPSLTYAYYHSNVKPKPTPKSSGKVYVCPLCGYEYDEEKEKVPFENLPDDWSCPLCGCAKEEFTLKENLNKPQKAKSNKKVWVCSICGYEYDEEKEKVPFEDLPNDWVCPLCKHPKSDFELREF